MAAQKRVAFTLVELLVVISIIGVLMGLLLPAVQGVRENGRRTVCSNNQKQLSTAVLQYHNNYKRFPGYVNAVGPDFKPASWAVILFPYIDRMDLWNKWSKVASIHQDSFIDLLICPSNPPPTETTSMWAYAVNGGYEDDINGMVITEKIFHGTFFNHWSASGFNPSTMVVTGLSYLTASANDGASTTLMLTENINQYSPPPAPAAMPAAQTVGWRATYFNAAASYDAVTQRSFRAVIWHQDEGLMIMNIPRKINGDLNFAFKDNDHARPSSYHPQGVVAVFCDGHTKFINQAIDYGVYKQIMTSCGSQAQRFGSDPGNLPYSDAYF